MRIATWNVNSVRLRIDHLQRLVDRIDPDVLCLQETKVQDGDFPRAPFAALGYRHALIHGMKSYNGVAIFSRVPLRETDNKGWCGRTDCRHIFATLPNGTEIHNLYIPAGGDIPDPDQNPKFAHKLDFLRELAAWFAEHRRPETPMVLCGDLNVAPLETDVWSHKQLLKVVSHTPIEIELLAQLAASIGWVDAVRAIIPSSERLYSWWSYRSPDWTRNDRGRRLDHVWVSPALQEKIADAQVLREARAWEPASDHVPVVVELRD